MERTDRPGMNTEKKMLLIFLLIAFGLPLLLRIPQGFLQAAGVDTYGFAGAHMLYPAAGFMLATLICQRENKLLPRRLFYAFLLITLVMALWNLTLFFLPEETVGRGSSFMTVGGSLLLIFLLFGADDEKRRAGKITGGNWKLAALLLLLFMALHFVRTLLPDILLGFQITWEPVAPSMLISIVGQVFFMFPLSFIGCFGEEYGWRAYFQPFLQRRFGLIAGVFVFGVLWELWHVLLASFYPLVGMPLADTLMRLCYRMSSTISVGIFFAFGYMKTGNLWLPIALHYMSNYLASVLPALVQSANEAFTWPLVGVGILVNFAVFLPFLFSKVFRTPPAAAVAVEVAEAIEASSEMEGTE